MEILKITWTRPHRMLDKNEPWRDTMPTQPAKLPACTADACRGGRVPCPCPEACQLDDGIGAIRGLLSLPSLASAVVTVAACVAFVLWVTA